MTRRSPHIASNVQSANPPLPFDPFVTADELGQILRVEARYVRRIIEDRRIPFIRFGNQVRFERQAISEFIEASRVAARPSGLTPY